MNSLKHSDCILPPVEDKIQDIQVLISIISVATAKERTANQAGLIVLLCYHIRVNRTIVGMTASSRYRQGVDLVHFKANEFQREISFGILRTSVSKNLKGLKTVVTNRYQGTV